MVCIAQHAAAILYTLCYVSKLWHGFRLVPDGPLSQVPNTKINSHEDSDTFRSLKSAIIHLMPSRPDPRIDFSNLCEETEDTSSHMQTDVMQDDDELTNSESGDYN